MRWYSVISFLLGSIMAISYDKNWAIFVEALICLIVLILHITNVW